MAGDADSLAVLIDADNAQAAVIPSCWRRWPNTARPASNGPTATGHPSWAAGRRCCTCMRSAGSAVQLHERQERHRFGLIIDAWICCTAAGSMASAWCRRQRLHPLATRIREAGLAVYGFGEKKTPKPFVAACDKFIYTGNPAQRPTAGGRDEQVEGPSPIGQAARGGGQGRPGRRLGAAGDGRARCC